MAALALLLTAVPAATAAAQTPPPAACAEISYLPYTITAPGEYCVSQSLRYDGGPALAAIVVEADDVTVDFKGHALHAAPSAGAAIGVLAIGRHHVTVRNGAITGLGCGILLAGSQTGNATDPRAVGNVIESMRIEGGGCASVTADGVTFDDPDDADEDFEDGVVYLTPASGKKWTCTYKTFGNTLCKTCTSASGLVTTMTCRPKKTV